jgi:hypothetical protein
VTRNAPARSRWRAFVPLYVTVFAPLFVLAGAFHLWFDRRTLSLYAVRDGRRPRGLEQILVGA